jgi:solute carrier family 41
VLPTLSFTIIGLLFTGELFSKISVCRFFLRPRHFLTLRQRWNAMTSINELVAIVLAILNLKGNIEMNLSARLGTAANMGDLDDPSVRNTLIFGNLALIQVQAATVSFIAACIAFLISTIFPSVGEESQAALSTETRNLFHYSRTLSLGHSNRGPRPVLLPVGASKSGFNEYVSYSSCRYQRHYFF